MALITRFVFLSNRMCSENFMFSLRNHSLNHPSNYKILTNQRSTQIFHFLKQRNLSSDGEPKQKVGTSDTEKIKKNQLSQRALLKQAVRDYGTTIIVFHIAISLTSLGICYIAVSNGVDVLALMSRIGFPDSIVSSKSVVGGSTFVVAYAVHKLFTPVRIAITLSAAPFIVKYLRIINLLKPPK